MLQQCLAWFNRFACQSGCCLGEFGVFYFHRKPEVRRCTCSCLKVLQILRNTKTSVVTTQLAAFRQHDERFVVESFQRKQKRLKD